MKEKLFKCKSISDVISESESKNSGLKRNLSTFNLVSLGIGAIVGTGIFVVTGTAAAEYAGPGLTISFVISAFACIMAGLCYAEFAAMMPVAGSVYSYSYTTMGEMLAWFVGWILVLEYLLACSSVAVGWSGYMMSLFHDWGIELPKSIAGATFEHTIQDGWYFSGSIINFPAVFIIGIITSMLLGGIKQSAFINNVIVVIKVAVILLFIGFGLSYIDTTNWFPYIPENTGSFGEFGWSGIMRGAGVVFYAYLGFDALSTASQEAKNPQRDMPRAILLSLTLCSVLYIGVTAVLTGMVHYSELAVPAPIALAIDKAGEGLMWLSPLIKLGAIAGLSSVILVMMLGQSRIYYSISKDGLLPPVLSKIHKKHGTPHRATIFASIVTAIVAGLFPLSVLVELVSIGTLLAFTIVCASVLVLRKTQPDLKRPFKTPLMPYVPILGIIICVGQMIALPANTWYRFIVWSVIGLILYFTYGIKHSKLNNGNK